MRAALARLVKLEVTVRLATWSQESSSWSREVAANWNYAIDPKKATIEDLRQAICGHMVLGKVSILYAIILVIIQS